MVRREKANYVIQSVSHALDVLEQFSGNVDEIGVTELSKRLKLHKNNVFRLLATLEARGYIEQNKSSENYRLGLKCLQVGQTYIHQMGLLMQSRTILESLAKSTRESVYVGIRKGGCHHAPGFCRAATCRAGGVVLGHGVAGPLHGGGKDSLGIRSRRRVCARPSPNGLNVSPTRRSSSARVLDEHIGADRLDRLRRRER